MFSRSLLWAIIITMAANTTAADRDISTYAFQHLWIATSDNSAPTPTAKARDDNPKPWVVQPIFIPPPPRAANDPAVTHYYRWTVCLGQALQSLLDTSEGNPDYSLQAENAYWQGLANLQRTLPPAFSLGQLRHQVPMAFSQLQHLVLARVATMSDCPEPSKIPALIQQLNQGARRLPGINERNAYSASSGIPCSIIKLCGDNHGLFMDCDTTDRAACCETHEQLLGAVSAEIPDVATQQHYRQSYNEALAPHLERIQAPDFTNNQAAIDAIWTKLQTTDWYRLLLEQHQKIVTRPGGLARHAD